MSLSYNKLKEINAGDILYDCEAGINIEFKVLEVPMEEYNESLKSNQLSWKGITPEGEEIKFLIIEKFSHYGPRIYTYKAYAHIIGD